MPVSPYAMELARKFAAPMYYARQGTPAKRRTAGLPVAPRTRTTQNQTLTDYARKIGITRYA